MFHNIGIAPRRHCSPLPSHDGDGRIAVGADSGARLKHCTDATDEITIRHGIDAQRERNVWKPLKSSGCAVTARQKKACLRCTHKPLSQGRIVPRIVTG